MEVDEDSSNPASPLEKTPPLLNTGAVKTAARRGRKPGRKGAKSDMKVKLALEEVAMQGNLRQDDTLWQSQMRVGPSAGSAVGAGSPQESVTPGDDLAERSRQSARECRARKKLRYQYLEVTVAANEKAVVSLYQELEKYRQWATDMDNGVVSEEVLRALEEREAPNPAEGGSG